MKPQDILFFIIFVALLWKRNSLYLVITGLVCLLIAIPLFYFTVFFTAQRLVMYAGACFIAATILLGFEKRK